MVSYTAWLALALLGTVAATSLQPYFFAMNKFFRDPTTAAADTHLSGKYR
jgi:hypothetical protein